ncbi:MAG: septum formation initiator family protein [Clostridia bacterium]|nr:septum formation initiator family protein [Clostridia bacterium]
MTKEKAERLIRAISVTGTILLVVLFLIVAYQLIVINVAKNKKAKLEQDIAQIQQQIETSQSSLEYYRSKDYLLRMAREYHYVYEGDITDEDASE